MRKSKRLKCTEKYVGVLLFCFSVILDTNDFLLLESFNITGIPNVKSLLYS